MLSEVKSMTLIGIEGKLINVQVDISSGLPSWDVVGLPDISIKESKQRVRTALKNNGYDLPSRKITINLAPADIKKEGSFFDLPIALGILADMSIINLENLNEYIFIGELSLNGDINKINGVLPMCIEAKNLGIKKVIIPYDNRFEASIINELEIYPAKNLLDVILHIQNEKTIDSFKTDISTLFSNSEIFDSNFSSVKGQYKVKRALEIAAAGGHNCLLIGSPGSGKTLLSKCIPSILPDLTFDESLEITKIHSIAGILPKDISMITKRPFRNPHHSISNSALVGGGKYPKPGEISLAHNGVLFLDELPEFGRNILELMREPLEDKKITISRVSGTLTYPTNFMLIASMNPCPCGYYGQKDRNCHCTETQISNYMNRISGPLLDRIDIHIEVEPVKYQDLSSNNPEEDSSVIKQRVNKARNIQNERFKDTNIHSNSMLTPNLIKKYCILDKESSDILKLAFERLSLSARAHDKILKVARTIADLEGEKNILAKHITEAISYRSLDRKFFK